MIQTEIHIRSIKYAEAAFRYMLQRGDRLAMGEGEKNLVYLEGMNPDFTPNDDAPDRWNDLRCVLEFLASGQPYFSYVARATCEPGGAATFGQNASKNGGVARLQLIQYKEACMMGFHKSRTDHPALVQCGQILVHRDANRDMKRTGDPIFPAYGINHHSTKPGFTGESVGNWSEGCCVVRDWNEHLAFIQMMKTDPRYMANPGFRWDFALLDASRLKIEAI